MIERFFLVVLLLCTGQWGVAQAKLQWTRPLEDAYKDISSLKLKSGELKLRQIKLNDDDNFMVYYIENYIDFFTLFIQEDESQYRKLLNNKEVRLAKIKTTEPSSPYYLFCQAEIILQWATIKLKFDDKISAAKDLYEAYRLLEKNKKKFPSFIENNKSLSIIHALAESMPGWIRAIMGIKGSVDLGTSEIRELANNASTNKSIYKEEIAAIYIYIMFYSNNRREEAFGLFDKYQLDHTANPLLTFLKATIAQKIGKNELAIQILEERPRSSEYLPFYYLDFMYGKFKLNKLEKNANIYIQRFVDQFNGKHYIKEAYQKLAWYDIVINNDTKAYRKHMQQCLVSGPALLDEDIQAEKEARSGQVPNDILLKSRLLFDGGYYAKAQNLLVLNSSKFVNAIHDGEYYYRLARITEALKNYTDAIEYFKATLIKSDPAKYYACSAALQLGIIYEQQKRYKEAKIYFEKCTNLDAAGYSASLHQKAKTGLDRLNKLH